jgi:glycosyltransferase involved in cell wall biosynthesis
VSVIIPAFNAGRTIDAALQSVFAQTYRSFEVIVVDDGSTDDTAERVQTWDGRVTLLRQTNAGPAAARNRAMEHARGALLAFLDADDVWLPTKLARQVEYFDRYPETGLLHGDAPTSSAALPIMLDVHEQPDVTMAPPVSAYCALFHCEFFVRTLTVMVPRTVIDAVGGFDERRQCHIEDWDLWLRIAARHPIGYLPGPMAIHRPDGGMSSHVEKTFRGQQMVIEKALPLCADACALHRQDPARCIRTREHQLHVQLGYERFRRGRTAAAREALRNALRLEPGDWRVRRYLAASYLTPQWIRRLRGFRASDRANGNSMGTSQSAPTVGVDLLQDTFARRLRSAVIRAAHNVDDAVLDWRGGRRRVLFEATSPLSMAVFQPVYERMRHDERLEFFFTAKDRAWQAQEIFHTSGITERVLAPHEVRWQKFHAYINTDFWNMTWLHRRTRRLHLFHGLAGKYDLDAPMEIAPVVAAFDRLMFANVDRLNRYVDAGLVDAGSPRAALIGYPKVDCLVDGSLNRAAILYSLGLEHRSPTVLYAPTWSPHSSLNTMGVEIIEALARLGINVIVKLHDRSLDKSVRGAGGVDWRHELRQLCRKRAVHLAEGSDASPYLFVADVLVTDHSSVGFEFMLLDRPLVVVHSPDLLRHGRVNPQKAALLRSASHVVERADSVAGTVRRALADPLAQSAIRRRIASELFYRPGTATARAAECIYEVLELPALHGVPSAVPDVHATPSPVPMRPFEIGARHT